LNITSGSGSGITVGSGFLNPQSIQIITNLGAGAGIGLTGGFGSEKIISTNISAGTGIDITTGTGTEQIISSALPSGTVFMNGLVWTQDVTSTYWTAAVPNVSPLLTATSKVGATIELRFDTSQAYTDSAVYWLAATFPSSAANGSIKFVIPSVLTPQNVVNLNISWFVSAF